MDIYDEYDNNNNNTSNINSYLYLITRDKEKNIEG